MYQVDNRGRVMKPNIKDAEEFVNGIISKPEALALFAFSFNMLEENSTYGVTTTLDRVIMRDLESSEEIRRYDRIMESCLDDDKDLSNTSDDLIKQAYISYQKYSETAEYKNIDISKINISEFEKTKEKLKTVKKFDPVNLF